MDNSRILVIGDLHFPYHHPLTFEFLERLKKRFNPTRVISIGDESDGAAWKFHPVNTGLANPDSEFEQCKRYLQKLHYLFPIMDIVESNHGSLVYRKGQDAKLPKQAIKDYNELWEIPKSHWRWHFHLTIDLPNGQKVYFHHSRSSNVLKVSQAMGINVVQGHHHEKMGAQYWSSPDGELHWAAQTGCLADIDSLAMAYGKNNLKFPCLGSLMIIGGWPLPVPLVLENI